MQVLIRFIYFVFNSRLSNANILLKFNLFSVLANTKAWFCSLSAIKVPYKDHLFTHQLQEFGVTNRKVCNVALIVLKWHNLVFRWLSCFAKFVF